MSFSNASMAALDEIVSRVFGDCLVEKLAQEDHPAKTGLIDHEPLLFRGRVWRSVRRSNISTRVLCAITLNCSKKSPSRLMMRKRFPCQEPSSQSVRFRATHTDVVFIVVPIV